MKCRKCNDDKLIEDFNYKNKSLGIKKKICKNCEKDYRKTYYENNKKEAVYYSSKSTKEIRKRNAKFVWEYLKEHPCVDCGESNPIVLEFDHKDKSLKIREVSRMVSNSNSIEKISEEIEKCCVRCANCHRIKTVKQLGWFRGLI